MHQGSVRYGQNDRDLNAGPKISFVLLRLMLDQEFEKNYNVTLDESFRLL